MTRCPLTHDLTKYFAGLDNYVERLFGLPEGFSLTKAQEKQLHSIIFEKPEKPFDVAMKTGKACQKGFESGRLIVDEHVMEDTQKLMTDSITKTAQKLMDDWAMEYIRNDVQSCAEAFAVDTDCVYYYARENRESGIVTKTLKDILDSAHYEITYDEKENMTMGKMYMDYSKMGTKDTTCITDTRRGVTVIFGTTNVRKTDERREANDYGPFGGLVVGERILAQKFECTVYPGGEDQDLKRDIINLIANQGTIPPKDDRFHIARVIFNKPATIVFWKDGTKTVVRCGDNDIYDPEKGLAMCFAKKALGNKFDYYNTFVNHLKKAPKSETGAKKPKTEKKTPKKKPTTKAE